MTVVRDVALILLAVEGFVFALAPLTVLGGLVYGLWWLRRHENLPHWLRLAQLYVQLGRTYVERAMMITARPVFLVNAVLSTLHGWLSAIARLGGGR